MVKQKSLKGPNEKGLDPVFNMDKFIGEGVMFKCKLFGFLKVEGPRGDQICEAAITRLKQQAKQLNKESKIHKQRIFLNISLKGIRIIDQQSRKLEHAHVVHKISYISHDKDDRRTFAYIVSLQEGYNLFAFKAEKNAGVITANLKELFHVVYLKHKQEREKGKNGGTEEEQGMAETGLPDKSEIEEGEEAAEQEKGEDPYAVPMKFQLIEKTPVNEYAVPSSRPAIDKDAFENDNQENNENDGANLLNWEDVNQELEFMEKDLKRSDTKQLLAELGDFNLDQNPPRQPEKQSVFLDDPFFESSGFSEDFSSGMKTSTSNPSLRPADDPFFPASNEFTAEATNLSKSRSLEFGLFDSNDAFSSTLAEDPKPSNAKPFLSDVDNLFSSVPASQTTAIPAASDWSTQFGARDSQQFSALEPTVNDNSLFTSNDQPPSIELVPEKISEPNTGNGDPFAALNGDISDIRGTLPSGGNVPQFPKKGKPAPTSPAEAPRVVSPGPSFQPSQAPSGYAQQQYQNGAQGGFSQNNPFNQSNVQTNMGYSQRFSPPPIPSRPDMPPIPMRQDLMQGRGGFQSVPSMQQNNGPPMPKPYSQASQASFQMQGNNFGGGASMISPSQAGRDPFADLGGAFSISSTSTTQEPLYAVVDKSKKTQQQGTSDMFGMFDNSPSFNRGSNGLNPTSNTAVSNSTSDQDPFGFGF